jgi:hypothetical protein
VLTTIQGDINQCVCDICKWEWQSLAITTQCPQCSTRMWNGAKPRGRPRNPLQPPARPKRSPRRTRKELPEYSTEW